MLLNVISDTHFEFMRDPEVFWAKFDRFAQRFELPKVLILAGDICQIGSRYEALAKDTIARFCDRYSHVLYVLGNHESYGTSISETYEAILRWGFSNLRLLRAGGNGYVIDGQRFLGGTMWYPDSEDDAFKYGFPDYRCINRFEEEVYLEHELFLNCVANVMTKDDVVITHHLPSPMSTPTQFTHSPLNPYFVANIETQILEAQPKLFIHGHTHTPCSYRLGETQVYCNPMGYPGETDNRSFWKRIPLVIP